jgi:hypothetical protein
LILLLGIHRRQTHAGADEAERSIVDPWMWMLGTGSFDASGEPMQAKLGSELLASAFSAILAAQLISQ